MPLFFMFKCSSCSKVIQGPEVKPNDTNNPKVGFKFKRDIVPGVLCPCNIDIWNKGYIYTGKENHPPKAPPLPAEKPKGLLLPTKWDMNEDGSYTKKLKYPNIPSVSQTQLIQTLEPLLGDENDRVALLGASYDRFDEYDDVEDDDVGDLDTAEKWLTVPLVLDRLNKVAGSLQSKTLWQQKRIDRQLGGKSADLMLPSGVDNFKFHSELLNDLINPRGGHSVAADTYAQAIKKAISLQNQGNPGNERRGSKRGYYFHSNRSNRGLNVVLTDDNYVLTVYYSGAATAWWDGPLAPELRLERRVT